MLYPLDIFLSILFFRSRSRTSAPPAEPAQKEIWAPFFVSLSFEGGKGTDEGSRRIYEAA